MNKYFFSRNIELGSPLSVSAVDGSSDDGLGESTKTLIYSSSDCDTIIRWSSASLLDTHHKNMTQASEIQVMTLFQARKHSHAQIPIYTVRTNEVTTAARNIEAVTDFRPLP